MTKHLSAHGTHAGKNNKSSSQNQPKKKKKKRKEKPLGGAGRAVPGWLGGEEREKRRGNCT